MNKHIILYISLLLLTITSKYINAEILSDYKKCLRFNATERIHPLVFHSTVNPEPIGWVNTHKIDSESGNISFIAKSSVCNLDIKETVTFEGVWPTEYATQKEENGPFEPRMNVLIRCQWDVTNGTPVYADCTITNKLLETPFADLPDHVENDIDIYTFVPACSNYCIEVSRNSQVTISMSLNQLDYFTNQFVSTTNALNFTVAETKRFYKNDWVVGTNYYIRISPNDTSTNYYKSAHDYIFTIKNVRPLIFVHGINSHPTDFSDDETAFGEMKKCLKYIYDLAPVSFYDFPWDPKGHVYTEYCSGPYSLDSYAVGINNKYCLLPVVIAHSMGGMLTLRQLINANSFSEKISSIVFFGTPFCGADSASIPEMDYFSDTHFVNVYYLKRGTKNVWDYISSIPPLFNTIKKSYIVGTNNIFKNEVEIKKFKFRFKLKYKSSTGIDCDGIVAISSANLSETLQMSSDIIEVDYNHVGIKELKPPFQGDKILIFDKLKEHIN